MNFDIEALSIVLNTNIPDTKYKSINFTRKMLYNPENKNEGSQLLLNDYPYFTHDIQYPRSNLVKFSYQDRIDFFFNLDRFNELLTPYMANKLDSSKKDSAYYKNRKENIDANIITMLLLLFPTKYPMINELYNSYDYVISHRKIIQGMLYNPFATQLYSYLEIGGKKYTTKSVAWLNDIMNHPIYNEFLREYRDFDQAAREEIENSKREYEKKLGDVREKLKSIFDAIEKGVGDGAPSPKTLSLLSRLKSIDTFLNKTNHYIFNKPNIEKKLREYPSDTIQNNSELIKSINFNFRSMVNDNGNWSGFIEGKSNNLNETQYVLKLLDDMQKTGLSTQYSKYKNAEGYFEKTFNELNDKAQGDTIRKFYILLRRLRGTFRQSSNYEFQKLINIDDAQLVPKFYDYLKNVSNYMRSEKLNETPIVLNEEYIPLINVGLSFINTSVSDNRKTPKREINIMIDLIEGIVDDSNWKDINCSYLSEYLGNEFEAFGRSINIQELSSFKKTSINDWRVDKNRMLYSIKKGAFSPIADSNNYPGNVNKNITEKKQENVQPQSGEGLFQYNYKKVDNFDSINNNFIQIFTKIDDIKKAVAELNKSQQELGSSAETNTEYINDNNLLEFLMKNNDKFNELFVKQFRTDEALKTLRLIDAEYIAKSGILEDSKNTNVNISKDQEARRSYDLAKYKLYSVVSKRMIDELKARRNQSTNVDLVDILQRGGNRSAKKKIMLNKTHKRRK